MIDWINCISDDRSGKATGDKNRTNYQRDYDRLIFSSAFRRLQNKTQVFPLPGNTFVHNRLTHSLEVASVGRSLGSIVGMSLSESLKNNSADARQFYQYDLSSVIAAGCLAHDLGNPPFGHSGEKAISTYFLDNANKLIDGQTLRSFFTDSEWADVSNFEGNANAFHIITYPYQGKLEAGMQLTYSTLASILKYPCEAQAVNKGQKHTKKYGFFQADQNAFFNVVQTTHMIREDHKFISYKRHPFVYLVEAADDICYRIIDLEDAHRIGILDNNLAKELMYDAIADFTDNVQLQKIYKTIKDVSDKNEQIAYLRAKLISCLINQSAHEFLENKESIINGNWNYTLMDNIENRSQPIKRINEISIEKIYDHHSVIQVELAGYKVLSEILDIFITALLIQKKSPLQNKTLLLLPDQFKKPGINYYEQVLNILDFVAGMTDGYAMEMYRNFKGIEIAKHH